MTWKKINGRGRPRAPKGMIVLDFETINTVIDLTSSGVDQYVYHRNFYPVLGVFSLSNGDYFAWTYDPKLSIRSQRLPTPIRECLSSSSPPVMAAFNIGFDKTVWERLRWPEVEWYDIQASAAYFNLPMNVDSLSGLLFGYGKIEGGKKLIRDLNKGRVRIEDGNNMRDLLAYCVRDVELECMIINTLGVIDNEEEVKTWQLTEKMNERGIYVDRILCLEAKRVMDEVREILLLECRERIDSRLEPKDLRSPVRFRLLMETLGEKLPDARRETLMPYFHIGRKDIETLVAARRAWSTNIAKKFDNLALRVDPRSGRLRHSWKYHGARTGRWTSLGVQLQNIPRSVLKVKGDIERVMTLVKRRDTWGVINYSEGDLIKVPDIILSLIRPSLIGGEGKELLIVDYKSIEARGAAYLGGGEEILKKYERGDDLYVDMAEKIFGGRFEPGNNLQRFIGKTAVLGLGYGMGAGKLESMVGKELKEAGVSAEDVVHTFRKAYSFLAGNKSPYGLWYRLMFSCRSALREPGKVISCGRAGRIKYDDGKSGVEVLPCLLFLLPSGRVIRYYNPRVDKFEHGNSVKYENFDKIKYDNEKERWVGKEEYLHGGKILENICQAMCRDIMVYHMLLIEELYPAIGKILGSVHDEVWIEIREGEKEGNIADMLLVFEERKPPYLEGKLFPLDIEFSLGKFYFKN